MIRLKRPRKLDTNWVYVGSGCYENNDGLRIHIGGLIICIADKPKETMFRVNEFSDTIYIGCLKVMGWKKSER
ncbi:hypothetical protein [Vibrio phage P23]|nr:hypothetical protein [Vibrio phage P23]